MAARRKVRGKEAELAFEALSIEGGLLSADWLARAAQLSAGNQTEADYRVPKGLNLRDEIGRYWRVAQAHWREFAAGRAGGADPRALAERFVQGLLRESFGFASLVLTAPVELEDRTYPIGALALGKRVPVVVAPAGSGLDTPSQAFGDGGRRRSAFGLAQEYLNASDDAVWGLVCDGVTLRVLRDNASLTRPAWIEADLASLFTEERYADFAALWLIAHETRFGAADRPPSACALEVWRAAGREQGTRAREHLRQGVEDALAALGQGFLSHPDNQALRSALETRVLTRDALFQQLLRLVYRLIFLLTVEERGVLHEPGAPETARSLYSKGYGLRRLRDRSVRRSGYDRAGDLWDALRIVLRGIARGEPRLGLPALGGLFDPVQCPDLDAARLENRALLLAVFRLGWLREDGALARVNWRDMGPEELGSVYESLLELDPIIPAGGRSFAFATGDETRGNTRKTTGSYYTPDSLVQVLLDSALEPVIATTIAENPQRPTDALLALSIVDPACGSGHFLLSAARRLAAHVARVEAAGTPSAEQYRHALRQVVGRCIFGVDLNAMAVELCKVSLWMEAVEPGRPLSFLDSHIQHGNALLGATPELLDKGIPDAAWEPIEGDDKKIASALKKQNKADAKATALNLSRPPASAFARLGAAARAVDEAVDDSLPAVASKHAQWTALLASLAYEHQRFVADVWCAAFVWPKQSGPLREAAPTDAVFGAVRADASRASPLLRSEVDKLRDQYRFFHWYLQFPQVFATGGFDVVLGNPPWERVKLLEEEFFAGRDNHIAVASNAALRRRRIGELQEHNPGLFAEFVGAKRQAEGVSFFAQHSGRYPLTACGDINTYALFSESNRNLIGKRGNAGFIVQSDIATSETYKDFFASLLETRQLVSLYDFVNTEGLFPSVHRTHPHFCLTTIGPPGCSVRADLSFWNTNAGHLKELERHFSLTFEELDALNPETRTCAVFRNRRDAAITTATHKLVPVLGVQQLADDWRVDIFQKMIDATIHADVISFSTEPPSSEWCPVYEGRMVQTFNHRFATYEGVSAADREEGNPRPLTNVELADPTFATKAAYWVSQETFRERVSQRPFRHRWFVSMRYVSNTTNERTVLCCVRPYVPSNNKLVSFLLGTSPARQAGFVANMSSFALDYLARQKMGGTTLAGYIVRQLPVVPAPKYATTPAWARNSLEDWVLPRVLELTYTAWDLEPFAHDVAYDGPPFRWDPQRRFLLRCEVDAAFFHLYGLSRDDTDYVMDTFPVVRKNDEKAHGEYRTKREILEIYDAMAEAARTGKPYVTRLDPPPADSRLAHPPRDGGRVIPLRPAARPEPAIQPAAEPPWSPELLPAVATKTGLAASAGRWGTTLTGVDLGIATLAAVLRNMGRPASRDEVERAVVLSILPSLLQSKFDAQMGAKWRRAIGTANMNLTSIASLSIPWAEVLRRAALEHLLQVEADGRWSAGADIVDAPSAELDARALVSIAWLESASAASEDGELITQLGVLRAA